MSPNTTPEWWAFALMALVGVVMLAFTGTIYLLPTFVAYSRKAENRGLIATLNVLGGWTGIGWLGAFIWALTDQRHQPPVVQYVMQQLPPDTSPTP